MNRSSRSFKGVPFKFKAVPWQYAGKGAWIFVSLPTEISSEIRSIFKHEEQGWGRLQVTVVIGKSEWRSAIWWDSKLGTYLLPLKAEIRKQESILIDKPILIKIFI